MALIDKSGRRKLCSLKLRRWNSEPKNLSTLCYAITSRCCATHLILRRAISRLDSGKDPKGAFEFLKARYECLAKRG